MGLVLIFVTISISVVTATETPTLIVHEHGGSQAGKKATLTEAVPNFGDVNWDGETSSINDEASSVQAVKGRWILYENVNYEGDQMVVEQGGRINVASGHNDHYSSARPSFSELILYEKKVNEAGGKHLSIYGATPDFRLVSDWLSGSDWLNDEASSVQALKGTWELFEHPNYEGNRMVVQEGIRQSVVKNDHYSSARPVCTYQDDAATAHIRVYKDKSQQGTHEDYTVDTARLEDMDDEISSLRVWSGRWELYQRADFEGNRLVVEAPDQKDVKNDYYGSLRPVCETYIPTPAECTVTDITIHNNDNLAKKDNSGTQIVGILLDSSCEGVGTGHLVMDRTDSVEESVGIETGRDDEVNYGVTVGVSTETTFGVPGISAQKFEVSVEASVGGAHTFSKSESKETTTGYSQSVGYELEYATPAVAVLFGSVDKYKIDAARVPTTQHMTCPDGQGGTETRNKTSSIALTATTYQSADYWYLIKDLDQATCDAHYTEIYTCMQKFKDTYSAKFEARENIKAAFEACFNF